MPGCDKCLIPSHGYQIYHVMNCSCPCHTSHPDKGEELRMEKWKGAQAENARIVQIMEMYRSYYNPINNDEFNKGKHAAINDIIAKIKI